VRRLPRYPQWRSRASVRRLPGRRGRPGRRRTDARDRHCGYRGSRLTV